MTDFPVSLSGTLGSQSVVSGQFVGTYPTVSETGGGNTSGQASYNVSLPSFAAGDLLVIVAHSNAGVTQTWSLDSDTSKFTQLYDVAPGCRQVCKYRIMQEGDGSTLVVTMGSTNWLNWSIMKVPGGTFSGTPEAASASATNNNPPDPPSLTPSWGSGDTLWLVAGSGGSTGPSAVSANYTTFTARTRLRTGYRNLTASSDNPGTFTMAAAGSWAAGTIAVRQAFPTHSAKDVSAAVAPTAYLDKPLGFIKTLAGRLGLTDTRVSGQQTFPGLLTSSGVNGSATNQTITIPSWKPGDLLLVMCRNFSTSAQNSWTYNGSTSSFTQLVNTTGGISSHRVVLGYRIMQAGDTGNLVVAYGSGVACEWLVMRFPVGTWHGSTAPEFTQANNVTTSTGNPGSLTPSWGSANTLWLALVTTSASSINNNMTNYTSQVSVSNTERLLYRALNASSEDPGTITASGTTHFISFTIGIRPAATFMYTTAYEPNGDLGLSGAYGPTAISHVLAAATTPAGLLSRATSRLLDAALTLTGAFTGALDGAFTAYDKALDAAVALAGSVSRLTSRALGGTFAPTGASGPTATTRELPASVSPTGAVSRSTSRALAGALSLTGDVLRSTFRGLAGALSLTGDVLRSTSRPLAAAVSLTGETARAVTRSLAGALGLAGASARETARALAGTLGSAGSLISGLAIFRDLSAALTMAGSVSLQTGKSLAGALTMAGEMGARSITRVLASALTPAGDVLRSTYRALAGTVAPTGALGRATSRLLDGVLGLAGALDSSMGARVYHQTLDAALALSGAVSRSTSRALAGTVIPVGAVLRSTQRPLVGALSLAGSASRSVGRALSASVAPQGALGRATARALTAAAPYSGSLRRGAQRAFSAGLATAGALALRSAFARALTATLGSAGSVARSTSRALAATLATAGALGRDTARALTGALAHAGALARASVYALTGTLDMSGDIARGVNRSLEGAIEATGALGRDIFRRLSAVMRATGHIGAALNAGAVAYDVALDAALALSGDISRATARALDAAVTLSGAVRRDMTRALAATLALPGALARATTRAFTGGLRPRGDLLDRSGLPLASYLRPLMGLASDAMARFGLTRTDPATATSDPGEPTLATEDGSAPSNAPMDDRPRMG